ncbi:TOMM precursor leader peptide-binding protein [Bacteroidaceae bacterium HV4-6-C5C]|nr:TOMM precursor leader peptide-binding protein [Bacteroidaceae bacterium HV4-6-C5C]
MLLHEKYDIFFDKENNVYQIRTKGDVVIIEFTDTIKEDIFKDILKLYEKEKYYTFTYIKDFLSSKYDSVKILDVIQELEECYILTPENFGTDQSPEVKPNQPFSMPYHKPKALTDISEVALGYIGEKELGQKIKEKSTEYGYKKIEIYNIEKEFQLSEVQKIFNQSKFVIVDASAWNPVLLEEINKIALELKRPWLLIEGLVDFIFYSIGPIFWGKETGCYECYKSRLRSNDEFAYYTQAYESYLRENNKTAKVDAVPKLVKDYVASIVIVDISKFIGEWYIPETWRANLIIDVRKFTTMKHSFLKAPVCYTCNPALDYNPYPWLESVTLREE